MTTEERLAALEKALASANRRARLSLIGVAIIVGASVFCASTGVVKEVRASAFTLVDQNGKVRGGLTVTENESGLIIVDERGKTRAVLMVNKAGTSFHLADERGEFRAGLSVVKEGPRLMFMDEQGVPRAGLSVAEKTGPILLLGDEQGRHIWSAP